MTGLFGDDISISFHRLEFLEIYFLVGYCFHRSTHGAMKPVEIHSQMRSIFTVRLFTDTEACLLENGANAIQPPHFGKYTDYKQSIFLLAILHVLEMCCHIFFINCLLCIASRISNIISSCEFHLLLRRS